MFIASDEFMDAAAAQSVALGFKPAAVYVPHPIQDRTDEEMMKLAEVAYGEIIRSISNQA